jgi:hypothetical protein
MSSLFTPPKRRFPVTLGPCDETDPFRQLHPLRSFDPLASPFALTRVASSQRPILSCVYAPLELSPSTPWILDPPRPRGSKHAPSPEGSRPRPKGSCNPSRRVRPFRARIAHETTSSTDSDPLRDRPAPPLGGDPAPLANCSGQALRLRPTKPLSTWKAAFLRRDRLLL